MNQTNPAPIAAYSHTQVGYLLRFALWAFFAPLIILAVVMWSNFSAIPFIVAIFFLLIGWVFGSLTVEVSTTELRWAFGPGFWKKSIARHEIASAEATRTKFWYGFGIRLTPHGWLYNVQGLDAVQVTDTAGKTTLIGTDEPEALVRALNPTP